MHGVCRQVEWYTTTPTPTWPEAPPGQKECGMIHEARGWAGLHDTWAWLAMTGGKCVTK